MVVRAGIGGDGRQYAAAYVSTAWPGQRASDRQPARDTGRPPAESLADGDGMARNDAGHLALRGNAYSEIIYGPRGDITDLVPINPDAVRIQITDAGIPRYQVKDANGRERTLLWSEILHLRGMSATGYVGMSPIEYERASIGEALAAQDYGARFYENDAQSTRWIEMPGTSRPTTTPRYSRKDGRPRRPAAGGGKRRCLRPG